MYYKTNKILNVDQKDAYNIVANVDYYPNFIPWVNYIKEINSYNNIKEYEIGVDFKVIKEKFSTRDTFYPYNKIQIDLISGPFNFLHNTWDFKSLGSKKTLITFEIDFEFKSKIIEKLFGKVFLEAQKKILHAFEKELEKNGK